MGSGHRCIYVYRLKLGQKERKTYFPALNVQVEENKILAA
jgi:hypothetical protein